MMAAADRPAGQTGRPLRLGVLLSGGGRTLLNLLDEIQAGRLNAEVATVIGSRPCKGVDRAAAAGLDAHVVPYADFRDGGPAGQAAYSARISVLLDEASVDLVLLAGFLSKWTVPQTYLGRVMNIHPALLPRYGGKGMFGHHVHEAVLTARESRSGCTVHFVNNQYDAGPVILQRAVPVEPGDTADTLADRVFAEECKAYPEAIRLFAAGRLELQGDRVAVRPV